MRKRLLGSIAAVVAMAGGAWAQSPGAGDPPPPAGMYTPSAGGAPPVVGNGPAPTLMPPLQFGPDSDPQGLGPIGSNGAPPSPMYPPPGPYSAPQFQPSNPAEPESGPYIAPQGWGSVDYLLWFIKSQPSPFPLLTAGSTATGGIPGINGTQVLVGGTPISFNSQSGVRVNYGMYLDPDRRIGAEFSGYYLEQKDINILFGPNGTGVVARPYIDTANPSAGYTTLLIGAPIFGAGNFHLDTRTLSWEAEGNALLNIYRTAPTSTFGWSIDLLAGYRHFALDEEETISSTTALAIPQSTTTTTTGADRFGFGGTTTTVISNAPVPFAGTQIYSPATVLLVDQYTTRNTFDGGQLGFKSEVKYGIFTLGLNGKFAIGNMHQVIDVNGTSAYVDPTQVIPQTQLVTSTPGGFGSSSITINKTTPYPASAIAPGGLYAQPGNIGHYTRDTFAYIPEVNFKFGVNISRNVSAYVGYNFQYISNVIRPGSEVNPNVNTSLLPFSSTYATTTSAPIATTQFNSTSFYLQGVNFGVQVQY